MGSETLETARGELPETLSREPYPYADIRPRPEKVIAPFGPDRCMWASDQHRIFGRLPGLAPVPLHPRYHSYAQGLLDRDQLSNTGRTALFGGTDRRIMRWPA